MKGHAKDITCAASSFSLKLVATSGADGHILVWNYGLGLLEGLCKGHSQDVTHLQFLDPYPVLLSTDILGNVCVWGMPNPKCPPEHRFKCLLRFKNILLHNVYSVVLHACWFPGGDSGKEDLLVTGDESGQLKVRSMAKLIESKKMTAVAEAPMPTLTELRLRRRGVTSIPLPPAPKPQESFSDMKRGPGADLSDGDKEMPIRQSWHAHDSVKQLQAIRSKREVISTGFDHLVRIWSIDGTLLGTLRQGNTLSEEWLFVANTEAKIEAINNEATEVMYNLGLGPPPSSIANGHSRETTAKGEEDGGM
jgi:WD40 repeat protein